MRVDHKYEVQKGQIGYCQNSNVYHCHQVKCLIIAIVEVFVAGCFQTSFGILIHLAAIFDRVLFVKDWFAEKVQEHLVTE